MDDNVAQMIDHERWLLNNGLVSDSVKNQLFFCGSIVHKDVQAVELKVRPEQKEVNYILYTSAALLQKIDKYQTLKNTDSIIGMWRLKRLIKAEGCLDFQKVLSAFVADFCGPKWKATAVVVNFDTYVDSLENDDGVERDNPSS